MGITEAQLEQIVSEYPEGLHAKLRTDIRRQMFQVNLVSGLAPGGTIADIGGGLAMLTPGAAEAGMTAILIDDFRDPNNDLYSDTALAAHRARGVKIHSRDVIADGLGLGPGSLDVAISVDSMEHFHNSPKELFREVLAALKPGGWFIVGVPNAANLRKRIFVPLGRASWSSMQDWYETPEFRGHVREPEVRDLHYVARDLGLEDVRILGRNWLGYANGRPWVRKVTPLVDGLLQRRPTLCSDMYLIGRKP